MSGDPVRIEHLELTLPAKGPDEGRRFGEALARELQRLLPSDASGHIGRLDIRIHDPGSVAAVARAVRDAIGGSRR